MTIHINATCNVAKTFSVKREKDSGDESERIVAHLKVADIVLTREQIDGLLRQPQGWAGAALFDDLGAPKARLTLTLHRTDLQLTGVIDGGKKSTDPKLKLKGADLDGLTLELTPLGALLACKLSWVAAGDEVDDIADMLGKTCNVNAVIEDGKQDDLLAPIQRIANRDGLSMTMTDDTGKTLLTIEPQETGPRLSSTDEVLALLRKGWTLCGADPHFWLESADRSKRQGVWLNAARSALKRGLEPIAEADDEHGRWQWKAKERAA
jgi:hypothetical protein